MNQLLISFVYVMLLFNTKSHAFPPDETLSIDSTLQYLEEHFENDSIRMQNLALAWKLLHQVKKQQNDKKLAEVHQFLADWHDYYNEYVRDSVVSHQEQALEIYQSLGDQTKIAAGYITLSNVYINESEFKRSEAYIFNALKIYEATNDKNGEGIAYRKIGQLYSLMEENEQALEYDLKALQILKPQQDYYNACLTLINMTICYTNLKQYDQAITYANECIQILKDQNMQEFGIEARIYAFRGDAHKDVKAFDKAESDYIKAWQIIKSVVGEERAASWELDIGEVKALRGNYKGALPHLLRSIEAIGARPYADIWKPYQTIMKIYENLGDYENALVYSKKITASRDTLLSNKIDNLEAEGLLKYESGKKDAAIVQKDEQIKRKNQVQILSFSLVGLFALLLAGLFYTYRKNKNQSNQLALLNKDLQIRNQEKEILLKEIHHRVKNNLQLISSLLSLQSYSINDKAVKNAILDSQARVKSMSLIHQKLYKGTNLASVKMKNYFETLTDSLADAYIDDFEHVQIELQMNNIELDVDHAIPIGLITNELITNSLKYAFPENRQGNITVQLRQEENSLILDVADNGIGMNNAPKTSNFASGFGSELVEMLTQQLKGTMEQDYKDGFRTRIKFPFAKMVA